MLHILTDLKTDVKLLCDKEPEDSQVHIQLLDDVEAFQSWEKALKEPENHVVLVITFCYPQAYIYQPDTQLKSLCEMSTCCKVPF